MHAPWVGQTWRERERDGEGEGKRERERESRWGGRGGGREGKERADREREGERKEGAQAALSLSLQEPADSRWYITFEQFISSVQTEPDLCQFFAEQNTIDLGSSSVDPVLSPYTRTILGLT